MRPRCSAPRPRHQPHRSARTRPEDALAHGRVQAPASRSARRGWSQGRAPHWPTWGRRCDKDRPRGSRSHPTAARRAAPPPRLRCARSCGIRPSIRSSIWRVLGTRLIMGMPFSPLCYGLFQRVIIPFELMTTSLRLLDEFPLSCILSFV